MSAEGVASQDDISAEIAELGEPGGDHRGGASSVPYKRGTPCCPS
ncbi:hypothetical protein [Mycobacterium sp. 050134]